jgi:peptidyl-prolyl cis-trans isomerase D
MISWIQKYFQHHFRTIFAVLLAVIIISFVFTIGAAPGIGQGDRRVRERQFFSYNLNQADDQRRLVGDASVSADLQLGGFSGLNQDQLQNYAFQRAATLHLANEWHVPAATTAEVTEAIKGLRMFINPSTGGFDAKAYENFRDGLKTNPRGVTEADIARVIGDDVRAEKVNKLLGGPGYVLPIDIRNQLIRADTQWALAVASADYSTYAPEIKPTDAELTQFFEQAGGRYDIQPQVVASFLDFPALAHLPTVTVTDAEVRAFYDANPARFPKPADAKPADPKAPSTPDADFAAVRGSVEAMLKFERAKQLAVKAASDAALELYNQKITDGPALDKFVAAHKLTMRSLAPFSRETGPAEFGGSQEITAEAFRMNEGRKVSDALGTPTGAVILFWKETRPSRKPLFSEVRDRVAADYIENEKRRRFVDLGKAAKSQIEARLKAGDSFEAAAAAAGSATGHKLEVKTLPAFALREPPQDADRSLFGVLEQLEKGQVSDMVLNPDKGHFVYAADKKLPDVSESSPRYVEARAQLSTFSTRLGATAYVAELVERELKRTEPKVN